MALPDPDSELAVRAARGDEAAFAELVRLHHPGIMGLCLSLLRDPDEAQDAAQDAFIKAYRSLHQFAGRSSLRTWLYSIASNRCLDLLRRRKREKQQSLDALLESGSTLLDALQGERGAAAGAEGADLLQKILGFLSPEERALLMLREAQGLSYLELSQAQKCTVDAVKARLKRARRKLSEILRHLRQSQAV